MLVTARKQKLRRGIMAYFYSFKASDLSKQSAVLRISGPDANTYLQGQFTQDVRLPSGKFCYGLWLTVKGKVLADSYMLRFSPEEHLVVAPRADPGGLRERLESYLIADEVEIADESNRWIPVICWGGDLAELGGHLLAGPWPEPGSFAVSNGAVVFPIQAGERPAALLLVPADDHARWRERLVASGASEANWAAAEWERVRSGRVAVPEDIGPADLPNEGGLEAAAISYTKGCYLGQEVMSRLKNLGQVRRRLFRVRGAGIAPRPGDPLFQGEQRVGEMRSAAASEHGYEGFALLSLVTLKPNEPLARASGGAADIVVDDHG